MRVVFGILPALLLAVLCLRSWTVADDKPVASIEASATAYLSSLTDEQRAKAELSYDSPERVNWAFIPLETRKGMPLMHMNEAQKAAALQLLKSIVSQAGFDKSRKIMDLENVLRQLEGPNSHERRNPEKYYFTVYGKPSTEGTWGVSIEGHHLSLNFVIEKNKVVDAAPQFFASNPATLKKSYGDRFPEGLRVLAAEEQLGFELLKSMNAEQKKVAVVAAAAPKDIINAAGAQPKVEPAKGIAAGKLQEPQKQMLRKLIDTYCASMRTEVAAERWKLIEGDGFDNVTFAWMGAEEPGIGHYYSIQGSTFLIEFVNVQADAAGNPANHIHCVWHDLTGDFNLPIK